MGTIVELNCECGYTRKPLYVGCGRDRLRGGRELIQCRRCYYVTLSKTWTVRKLCSRCFGLKFEKIDEHDPAQVLMCPSCHQQHLRIEVCGAWD